MKDNNAYKPDAIYTEAPQANIFGQTRLDSGNKVYPSDNMLDKMFNKIRATGLTRSNNSWLGGVCGMIAEKTNISANIVRGIVAVLTVIMVGAPILVYGLAWALLADEKGTVHAQEFKHEGMSMGIAGSAAMVLFGLLSLFWGKIITIVMWTALIGGGLGMAYLWIKSGNKLGKSKKSGKFLAKK